MYDIRELSENDSKQTRDCRDQEFFRVYANNRCAYLFAALQYASIHTATLSVCDRILINQERGSLLHKIDYPESEERKVPMKVERKLDILHKMMLTNKWTPIGIDELSDNN